MNLIRKNHMKRYQKTLTSSSKEYTSAFRSRGEPFTQSTDQPPVVLNRENKELRFTITAWVAHNFEETCVKLSSGLAPGCSSSKTASEVLSMWYKCFTILERVTKAGVFHRDISFQNMRVDENKEPTICDFEMATDTDSEAIGAIQRTGTLQFMARGIFLSEPYQSFHERESIYWLCAMALNSVIASPAIKTYVERVTMTPYSLDSIYMAKDYFISALHKAGGSTGKDRDYFNMKLVNSKNETEMAIFDCLIKLSEYFYWQAVLPLERSLDCFSKCAELIVQAIEKGKRDESTRDVEPPSKKQKQ